MRDEIEFLIDRADAKRLRMPGILDLNLSTLEKDLSGTLMICPTEDFHERGFACAVLAEEDMNFAPPQLKINVIQRHDARESLPDVAHFQNGGICHLGVNLKEIRFGD